MQHEPNRPASKPKLREKVEGQRGIYRRKTRDGAWRYEIAYTDHSGRQRWETVGGLSEARRRRAELVSKPQTERIVPTRQTFAEFSELWFDAKKLRLRRRTAEYYRTALDRVLLPRFGRYRIAAIDADAIATLIRDLEREGLHVVDHQRAIRPLGSSSIENYLKPLQGVLALAVRRQLIARSPFDTLTADDRPRRGERRTPHEWTTDEITALIRASENLATRNTARYDYSTLLKVSATLGLRIGEVLGLRWEDFNQDADHGAGVLHVRRQWLRTREYGPPKTRAGTRSIPLPFGLRDDLIELRLRSEFSGEDRPVFSSLTGTPLHHRNVTRRGFEPARDLANLPAYLRHHDLRHAAASRLIKAGLDPVAVAIVLGHEDATTTLKIYGHLYDREKTSAKVREALAVST